jgi:hypothetical protein
LQRGRYFLAATDLGNVYSWMPYTVTQIIPPLG